MEVKLDLLRARLESHQGAYIPTLVLRTDEAVRLVAAAQRYELLHATWEDNSVGESDWLRFCQDFDWEPL